MQSFVGCAHGWLEDVSQLHKFVQEKKKKETYIVCYWLSQFANISEKSMSVYDYCYMILWKSITICQEQCDLTCLSHVTDIANKAVECRLSQ